jgi:AraC-like DNA-binding protein
MLPATRIDELARDPAGRYLTGETFLFFCADAGLFGFAVWGRVTEGDVRRLVQALAVSRRRPHVTLMDARRMEAIEPAAFEVLAEYARSTWEPERGVTRAAIVRAPGVSGAIVSGFYRMFSPPPPYPVELFDEMPAALAWLGVGPRPALVDELDELCARARGTTRFLGALRELLEARTGTLSLPAAARALAMSERTLQRRLASEGTTFQNEQSGAQLRKAQRLMTESDIKLTHVALEVGCASPQQFSAMFRRVTGESPSEWRARQRKG